MPVPTTTPATMLPTTTQLLDPVGLRIEAEHPDGYNRDLFRHWIDADGDGCDTRKEVLIAESLDPVQTGSQCAILSGRWYSIYDNTETTDSSRFDIDHVVALKEAWDSGAWNWTADQRRDFANDLSQSYFLIAVSASSNRSKSDRDPAEWMPTNTSYRCEYVRIWVQVKRAWNLSVDQAENDAIRNTLAAC
ncbi:MAG: HNH endonuclease family protein [Ilumatobacteraceae bacterium]